MLRKNTLPPSSGQKKRGAETTQCHIIKDVITKINQFISRTNDHFTTVPDSTDPRDLLFVQCGRDYDILEVLSVNCYRNTYASTGNMAQYGFIILYCPRI